MPSVKSYFNPTLFRKNFARFWPIWVVYLLICLSLPLFLPNVFSIFDSAEERRYRVIKFIFEHATSVSVPLSCVFGILVAMAVFSYLYSSRSVGFAHTLPMRREGLFLTSYLSGFCFFLFPLVLVFVISLLVCASMGVTCVGALLTWLLVHLLCTLFFYSFAVFCAMFTGHILALPAFYIIFNVLALSVNSILQMVLEYFLYGYSWGSFAALSTVAHWLTPASVLSQINCTSSSTTFTAAITGMEYALLYAVFGIVFAVLALLVYRRRQLEFAGDVVAVRWVRPIFRYGFAACFAMVMGCALYAVFSNNMYLYSSAPLLIFSFVLCGIIGYFLAEMLLQKSFRVFRRWKGCTVFSVCVLALCLCLAFDVTGYSTRIPSNQKIASVSISGIDSAPYDSAYHNQITSDDPEVIAQILSVHQTFISLQDADNPYASSYSYLASTLTATPQTSLSSTITYTLTSGAVMTRAYNTTVLLSGLNADDSLASQLQTLLNLPAAKASAYVVNKYVGDQMVPCALLDLDPARITSISIPLYDTATDTWISTECPVGDARKQLYAAILADFDEGTIGVRYLFDQDPERLAHTCPNDFTIVYALPAAATSDIVDVYDMQDSSYTQLTITMTPDAAHTISAMKELGMLTDTEILITNADSLAKTLTETDYVQ
ncbi:MAG: hypothetical protein LIO58_05230 [Oscillospiraceae bacterium]|nr:hypothetical protein [Oscillospiraceae bacterium]